MSWKDRAEPVKSDWRSRAEAAPASDTSPQVGTDIHGKDPEGFLGDLLMAVRSGASGLSGGWSDKLSASQAAQLSGKPYEEELAKERGDLDAFRKRNPPAGWGSTVLGALTSPLGAAGKGAGWLGRILGTAGQGAVAGAGNAQPGEELRGAEIGGITGGVLGTGGEAVRGAVGAVKGLSNAAAVRAATGASVPTILGHEATLPELATTARGIGASSPLRTLLGRRGLVQANDITTGQAVGKALEEGDQALQAAGASYPAKSVPQNWLLALRDELKANPLGPTARAVGVKGDDQAVRVLGKSAKLFNDPNPGTAATLQTLNEAKGAVDPMAFTGSSALSAQGRAAGAMTRSRLKDLMMQVAGQSPGLPQRLESTLAESSKAKALSELLETPSAYNNPLLKPLQFIDPTFGRLGTPLLETAEKVTPSAGVLTRLGLIPGHAGMSPQDRADANAAARRESEQ